MIILLLLFLLSTELYGNTFTSSEGKFIANPPYYAQYGYLQRNANLELFLPYIGIGLQPTKFSSSFVAQTGIRIHYNRFTWKLEYVQGLIPDMSLFDYKNLEYFGQTYFSIDFNNVRLSSLTKFGKLLYAFHSKNEIELEKNANTYFGIHQVFSIDSQLYNNDFIIMTGMLNMGFDFIPTFNQSSYFIKTVSPITFDFIHSKLGFMGTLFYTGYISKNKPLIIGENYSGYDEAINIKINDPNGLFNNFYHLTGTFDLIYRIYLRSLPSPADRIYFTFGGNIGFGYDIDSKNTDLLYMGTIAFGYEYKDIIPFEIRFTVDQNGNFFFNMSVVSPLSHRFDSNLD